MEFFDLLFDSDYKRRSDIEALKQKALKRSRERRHDLQKVEDQNERIEQLENQVGELALLCRSLLTALREDGTIEPENFQKVMERLDSEDGVIDGRITPKDKPPEPPPVASEIRPWPKRPRFK